MKRASRTTITWRFENSMAPHSMDCIPCQRHGSKLVMVIVTVFRGKAQFKAWFADTSGKTGPDLANSYRSYFFGSESSRQWAESLGLQPDHETQAVGTNGDAVHVDFVFKAKNGESLTHTACRLFIAFCDQFGTPEYRRQFFLPTPQIVQETMVEAYADDYWITYGEYVWDRHFAHIADAAVDATLTKV